MQAVQEAIPQAEADPMRPVFHFRPPARWMNDPNGTMYHKGWYHVFYQHHPFGDTHGPMYWGHARSRDLVHWEHLPIALWPSHDLGETDCYSGCAWKDGEGRPVLFYTKVDKATDPVPPFEQWAALPDDDDLLVWLKYPGNPLFPKPADAHPRWRDPFVFGAEGRVFMVVGACGEQAGTPLYEATSPDLQHWDFRGKLCDIQAECPNFARIGSRWIYLSSPYKPVEYRVGDFDIRTLTFAPETHGVLDYAGVDEKGRHINGFYASNLCFDDKNRCILYGWIRGWPEGRGWNGCLALPRLLMIGPDARPRQIPAPELRALRGAHVRQADVALDGVRVLAGLEGDAFELLAVVEAESATRFGMRIRCDKDGGRGIDIAFDGQTLNVGGTRFPFALERGERALFLHIFHDKSTLEVFANGGRAVATRVVMPALEDLHIAAFAEGGSAALRSADFWTLKAIW